MTQPDWPARLVQVVAGEVKRYRDARGMSAQQLADRCAELGLPIARSVLANLENGRRETVSVPELVVLARALGVPAVLLVFPVGRQDVSTVALPPDVEVDPWEALKWFVGDVPQPLHVLDEDGVPLSTGVEIEEWRPGAEPLLLYREHDRIVTRWRLATDAADRFRTLAARAGDDQQHAQRLADAAAKDAQALDIEDELRRSRRLFRAQHLSAPRLPLGLTHLDEQEAGRQ